MSDETDIHVFLEPEPSRSRLSAGPQPMELGEILTDAEIAALRVNFNQAKADETLMAGFASQFKASGPYINGLKQVIQNRSEALPLTRAQQELIIITMLTAQRSPMELALHVYLGIANGHSPEMIGETMMLVGIYDGVSAFAEGLFTAEKALTTLKKLLGSNAEPTAPEAIQAIELAFLE